MEEKIIKLIRKENEANINNKNYCDFVFEFQKSILLNLSEQGVINDIQCQICIEKLVKEFRKAKSA